MWIVHTLSESLPTEERFDWRGLSISPPEAVRVWAIRFLTDDWPLDTIFSRRPVGRPEADAERLRALLNTASFERSGLARLAMASVMQRVPVAERWLVAMSLFERPEDADDPNLPGMVWTALVPLAEADPDALAQLAASDAWPLINEWIARRLASEPDRCAAALSHLVEHVADSAHHTFAESVARGLSAGLKGRRRVAEPATWARFVATFGGAGSEEFARNVRELSVVFGDGRALDEVRKLALDGRVDLPTRRAALETLVDQKDTELRAVCEELLTVRFLNTTALRGLATIDDDTIGRGLARNYRSFHAADRPAVLDTLVARPGFAAALLDEVAAGKIPRGDITVSHARQMLALGSDTVAKRLAEVWGELRDSPADKRALREKWEKLLTPEVLAAADPSRGRVQFNRVCAGCHLLYGHGQAVGPDLTGSGRRDLGYLLDNIVDPSAVLSADYRLHVAELKDGRVLSGLVVARTPQTVTLRTAQDRVTVALDDIEELQATPRSLMPDGLLGDQLKEDEVRDLIAYLMSASQVPLPEERAGKSE
jgi:putative heme-binding domain-containing protein